MKSELLFFLMFFTLKFSPAVLDSNFKKEDEECEETSSTNGSIVEMEKSTELYLTTNLVPMSTKPVDCQNCTPFFTVQCLVWMSRVSNDQVQHSFKITDLDYCDRLFDSSKTEEITQKAEAEIRKIETGTNATVERINKEYRIEIRASLSLGVVAITIISLFYLFFLMIDLSNWFSCKPKRTLKKHKPKLFRKGGIKITERRV